MKLPLPNSRLKAIIAAFLVVAMGAIAFWLASRSEENSAVKTMLENFGGTFITIGVLGVIYDLALRQTLANELLRAVDLKAKIVEAGLSDIDRDEPAWKEVLRQGSALALRPLDPSSLSTQWRHVVDWAGKRAVAVEIYLPREDGACIPAIAQRLGQHDIAAFRSNLSNLAVGLARAWAGKQMAGDLHSGSSLKIYTYDELPPFGLVRAGDIYVLSLPAPGPGVVGGEAMCLTFGKGEDARYSKWLSAQLDDMPSRRLENVKTDTPVTPRDTAAATIDSASQAG